MDKIIDTNEYYSDCTLCPRRCHADRTGGGTGFCKMTSELKAAKAYLHMWEEPCITGEHGSGTVFFSGCNMKCIFCQNSELSLNGFGKVITSEELAGTFIRLQEKKASNINLVTGVCFIPHIINAVAIARERGLTIPVLYNSSGYESVDSLKMLCGSIDIYMPDMKYISPESASEYSSCGDYPETAKKAIAEMFTQTGPAVTGEDGLMKKGVIVRHMVLPGSVPESKKILRYLHDTYGNDIYISIMNQYTPMPSVKDHRVLSRKVSDDEYRRVLEFADKIGIEKGFTQSGEAAMESFVPKWDFEGI
ncbi:MAG: radical SAM protein [Lachnospiraceae bacterium]|nr:radical SAM protein [Lachnospiraceae bacterium]